MQIRARQGAAPVLEEADDFRRFHVLAEFGDDATEQLRGALGEAAELEGDAAWVSEAWIRAASDRADSPEWQDGLRRMVAFAQSRGWWREAPSAIRAHVVWAPRQG